VKKIHQKNIVISVMDIFYYSNYCKHSQRVLQFLAKGNLVDKISFICIDKRFYDKRTNQTKISLENGSHVILPPNIHSVPSLLLVNKNYHLVLGDDIIRHYEPQIKEKLASVNFGNGEPVGMPINSSGGTNIVSEHFSAYNLSPNELSAMGSGGNRPMYNYVSASNDTPFIETPPNTYKPDKVSSNVNMDTIQKKRNEEIQQSSLFVP
jgi:hypothetical protein